MNGQFYVYAHTSRNGRVIYVGKGSGCRCHCTGNRSALWKGYFSGRKFNIKFIEISLEEKDAYAREIFWITYFKGLGMCKANVSLGGEGVLVEKRWWGPQISKSLVGRFAPSGPENSNYKDHISKDLLEELYVKKRLSSTHISKLVGLSYTTIIERLRFFGFAVRNGKMHGKKIKCSTDGRIFSSICEAARECGVHRENIRKVLKGIYKVTGGKKFEYIQE
jgi:hypothetical protein